MLQTVKTVVLIRHARSTANDDPSVYLTTPDHAIPLSRPSDDPAALASAMTWLHTHADLLPTFGSRSIELASAYSAQRWADRWVAMCQGLTTPQGATVTA